MLRMNDYNCTAIENSFKVYGKGHATGYQLLDGQTHIDPSRLIELMLVYSKVMT